MKKSKKILLSLLLFILLITALLSGCNSSKTSAKLKTSTINCRISSDIVSLDPAFAYDSNTTPVVSQITEGLLSFDQQDKLVCRLAKSWKTVDNKTYVYEVRDDVKFSDGSPMTIDDVLFSLNRIKDSKTASDEGWMYANVASITKTGSWEITVKLSKPDSAWQYVFATSGGDIISKKYYDAHKNDFGKPTGGVLGTGPYVFKKWVTGSEIDLEKNPYYWDKSKNIDISKVVFKVIPDDSTLLAALKAGQVDVSSIQSSEIPQVRAYKNVKVILDEDYEATELAFNCQRAPLNDPDVRRAISCAVDTDSIDKNITKFNTPANALPFGRKVISFNTDEWAKFGETAPYYKYNMQQAKQFLAKSKYPNGFTCDVIVSSGSPDNISACLAIQQSLKELKINLNIKKYPFNDFVSYAYGNKTDSKGKRDYDMILWSWESDWPDPVGYMMPLYSSANIGQGGSNYAAYSNPNVDKLLDQQNQTTDKTERTRYLLQAISIANDEAAYRILSYPKEIVVINNKFSYQPSASWFYNFYIKDFKVN